MFRASVLLSVLLIASPVSAQFVSIQTPKPSATVATSMSVIGETGTAVDVLHVWGIAPYGSVFLGSVAPTCPPPGAASVCNYELVTAAMALPVGTYPIVVYGHDPVTNTFPWQCQVTVTVTMGPNISSGFGGVGAFIVSTGLDDAFTIQPSASHAGGVIVFGHRWPSNPSCIAQNATGDVTVSVTRTHATINTLAGNLHPIQVLCGGGR